MNSDRMIKMVNAQIAPTNEQMRRWGMSVDEIEQQRREEAELDAKYDAIYDAEQAKIDAVAAKWAVVIGKSARETRSMMERFAGSIGTPCGEWKSIPASRFSSPAAYDNFCAMMTEYDNLF